MNIELTRTSESEDLLNSLNGISKMSARKRKSMQTVIESQKTISLSDKIKKFTDKCLQIENYWEEHILLASEFNIIWNKIYDLGYALANQECAISDYSYERAIKQETYENQHLQWEKRSLTFQVGWVEFKLHDGDSEGFFEDINVKKIWDSEYKEYSVGNPNSVNIMKKILEFLEKSEEMKKYISKKEIME